MSGYLPKNRINVSLGLVLAATMGLGAFSLIGVAVVANDLTKDLGLSVTFFGAAVSVNTIVGAVFAPLGGRISDKIGGKKTCVFVLFLSAFGLGVLAIANNKWALIGGLIIAGFPQGWCNPATNKLIAERVPVGSRGLMTGIKQSGVQLSVMAAGLTVPTIAYFVSWRGAFGFYGFLSLVVGVIVITALGDGNEETISPAVKKDVNTKKSPLGKSVWLLAFYALFMGIAVGGAGRYLPLFGETQLGMSNFEAGLLSALPGGLAIFFRIWWARLAEERIAPSNALAIQALTSVLVMAMLLAAVPLGGWIMWPMTFVAASGLYAWNAVAMLSVIIGVPTKDSGRASGVVVMGFMAGLSIGGFFVGWIADVTGSFDAAWTVLLLLSFVSIGIALSGKKIGRLPGG
ncbi:MAG: MFS transporter [Acidimicrobiales bacterium]|nr:MFS transporter [Acidimicrobiales bacterium]